MPGTRRTHQKTIIIPSGASKPTAPLDLRELVPIMIKMPDAWTNAPITFSGSASNVAFSTSDYAFLAAPNAKIFKLEPVVAFGGYQLNEHWFDGINWLFVVSGDLSKGTGSLVNQGADRILTVTLRERDFTPVVMD